MATFADLTTAARLRDLIRRIVREEIDRVRPPYQYGTVDTINRTARIATVTLIGDTSPVTVGMGAVQPYEIGQRVRVGGRVGDMFIVDVMGTPYLADNSENWVAPTLTSPWVNVVGANPTGYFRDSAGVVHLRGRVSGGTNATTIFTLPVGYRPANTELFPSVGGSAFAVAQITSVGVVSRTVGATDVSFDGITFRAV